MAIGEAILLIRQHSITYPYHPKCLLEHMQQAMESSSQARPQLDSSMRLQRLRMLRQYAENKQRMKSYSARLPNPALELRIARLEVLRQILRLRVEELGGVPKSWLVAS